MIFRVAGALAVAAAVLAGPQAPAGAPTAAIVSGRVVDGVTGQPVAEASVCLSSSLIVIHGPAPPAMRCNLAKEDGRFEFRDVRPWSYRLSASKAGASGGQGMTRPGGLLVTLTIVAGQRLDGLVIPLWRPATISGTVVDERGRPLAGLTVRAVLSAVIGGGVSDGRPRLGRTDDRGMYRIAVNPGSYVVFVAVSHSTSDPSAFVFPLVQSEIVPMGFHDPDGRHVERTNGPVAPAPGADGRSFTYVTTFAPSARDSRNARIVTVALAEEAAGVDLRMELVRSFRVSGRILGGDTPDAVVDVRLISPEATLGFDVAQMSATNGTLTMMDVPEGDYTLEASRTFGRTDNIGTDTQGLWARVPVSVHAGGTDGWVVTLQPGLRVSGTVQFDQSAPADLQVNVSIERRREGVPSDDFSEFTRRVGYTGQVSNGAFQLRGVTPGQFIVRAVAESPVWTMKTGLHDGTDVADRAFEIGSSVTTIVVTMTNRAAGVSGIVRGDLGPSSEAEVVVFPVDRTDRIDLGSTNRRLLTTTPSPGGAYAFKVLPPGNYYLAAVDDVRMGDWPLPEFLQSLVAVATRVSLTDGEVRVVDLRVGGR